MINYRNIKGRNYFGMSADDLLVFSEIIWLLKHTPPPVGYNRRPFTTKQQRLIEDIYDKISYPENYAVNLNTKHDQ